MNIIPFEAAMLEEAANLLAEKHKVQRMQIPLLPSKYEDAGASRVALEHLLRLPGAMGVAAVLQDQLLGFLVSHASVSSIRGRHVWMHPAGHALHCTMNQEIYRDLYAASAKEWVRNGFFDHFILTPANTWDDLAPWLRLGFACEQAHALLAINQVSLEAIKANPNLVIRQALPQDRGVVRSFYSIIPRATAGAPVWGVALPEDLPEIEEGYEELLDEDGTTVWLAFLQGEAVGMHAYRTIDNHNNLLVPRSTIRLTVASTKDYARGLGVTASLLKNGLVYAKQQGFRYVETDWRITSLLASRTWPKLGFDPVACRLVRKVDQRISWASGDNRIKL